MTAVTSGDIEKQIRGVFEEVASELSLIRP